MEDIRSLSLHRRSSHRRLRTSSKMIKSLICLLAVVACVVAVPDCPESDGAYPTFFPHETSCQWYYMCSNQEAYLLSCTTQGGNDAAPIVLHWNDRIKSCDFPESAGCTLAP